MLMNILLSRECLAITFNFYQLMRTFIGFNDMSQCKSNIKMLVSPTKFSLTCDSSKSYHC